MTKITAGITELEMLFFNYILKWNFHNDLDPVNISTLEIMYKITTRRVPHLGVLAVGRTEKKKEKNENDI